MSARLDAELVRRGCVGSRERAKELIVSGGVLVDGIAVKKPSSSVDASSDIKIIGETLRYVGRGGLKLEEALKRFPVDPSGRCCLDAGASTGGFTDCLLQNGAALVYAVDVGTSQLAESLRCDKRVISIENTDIRSFSLSPEMQTPTLAVADLSFISLKLVLPALCRVLSSDGELITLIKPQFEAGRASIGKNGVVKDIKAHIRVLTEIIYSATETGFSVRGLCPSPIVGGSGNHEYLLYAAKGGKILYPDPVEIAKEAFCANGAKSLK